MKRADLVQDFAKVVGRYAGRIHPSGNDFVLADFLVNCLEAHGEAKASSDIWGGAYPNSKIDPWDSPESFDFDQTAKDLLRE